jgi:zinc protease
VSNKIKAVTAAQVMQVAKKYFVDDTLTVATLDPLPINGDAAKGARHAR